MKPASPAFVAAMILGASAPQASAAAPHPFPRYEVRIGDCGVVATAGPRPLKAAASRNGAAAETSFLVTVGRTRVMIGVPAAASSSNTTGSGGRGRSGGVDTLILPSLDERQAADLVIDGRPALPAGDLVIERTVLDDYRRDARGRPSVLEDALDVYRANGRLRIVELETMIVPGVRLTPSPSRPSSEVRVRVACGSANLLVLNDDDLRFARRRDASSSAVPEPRLAKTLASDTYTVATVNGAFPGLGRIYLQQDGYHWGSVRARDPGGQPLLRGSVVVEGEDNGSDI